MNKNRERKEDYFVQATLSIEGEEMTPIPCKIYLPERTNEKPWMEFLPKKDNYEKVIKSHEGSFKADVIGFDNRKEVSIEAPIIYFSEMSTRYWGHDLSESTFLGEPQDLKVIHHLHKSDNPTVTNLVLWISPNKMLSPPMSQTTSYTGAVEFKRVFHNEFSINEGIKVTFDKHFRTKKVNEDDLLQWSFLVAIAEIDTPAAEVEHLKHFLLPEFDDFLLIASLGSRTRTACIGWEAVNNESVTTYYRGNYTFPTGKSEHSFDQGLVWLKDFKNFIETCYPKFLSLATKDAVRSAIRSVVPGRKRYLEESFLSMFAGLETLILDFRRRENLEFVMKKNDWNQLKAFLKKSIHDATGIQTSKKDRSLFYSKLEDLNRVPLQYAFDQFCKSLHLDLSDLWPVFLSGKSVSLSDIRNRLIHGEPLSADLFDGLVIAGEHLNYLMERILISILGWPIEKTEVNAEYLEELSTAIKLFPEEQDKMSDMLWA